MSPFGLFCVLSHLGNFVRVAITVSIDELISCHYGFLINTIGFDKKTTGFDKRKPRPTDGHCLLLEGVEKNAFSKHNN